MTPSRCGVRSPDRSQLFGRRRPTSCSATLAPARARHSRRSGTCSGGASPVIPAGDFLDFDLREHPEWRGKTLFIDGLDEVRAWGGDARTPLGTLRGASMRLEGPVSACRAERPTGWDERPEQLARVAPDGELAVLRLDPLTDQDATRILATRSGIDDARSFVARARENGVAGFLDNPLCLNLLANAVAGGGGWPASRRELFEQACREMVREANGEHIAAAGRSSPSALIPDELLDAADACAPCSSSQAPLAARSAASGQRRLPRPGPLRPRTPEPARQAVSTKLFRAVAEGRSKPIHRHVAEFLAGRHLARLIDGERRGDRRVRHGVPARRVVALMTGHDGGVVTELRGLLPGSRLMVDRTQRIAQAGSHRGRLVTATSGNSRPKKGGRSWLPARSGVPTGAGTTHSRCVQVARDARDGGGVQGDPDRFRPHPRAAGVRLLPRECSGPGRAPPGSLRHPAWYRSRRDAADRPERAGLSMRSFTTARMAPNERFDSGSSSRTFNGS